MFYIHYKHAKRKDMRVKLRTSSQLKASGERFKGSTLCKQHTGTTNCVLLPDAQMEQPALLMDPVDTVAQLEGHGVGTD